MAEVNEAPQVSCQAPLPSNPSHPQPSPFSASRRNLKVALLPVVSFCWAELGSLAGALAANFGEKVSLTSFCLSKGPLHPPFWESPLIGDAV